MNPDFLSIIKRRVVLFDGGMGSMLIAAGLGRSEVPETWTLSHPDKVADIHKAYLAAGAEVIQTNTFGATRLKLSSSEAGRRLDVSRVNEKAAEICRKALDDFMTAERHAGHRSAHKGAHHGRHDAGGERFVAGDIGPTGLFFPPIGRLTAAEAREAFREQARALERGGVDLFLIETMYDLREALEALRAVREVSSRPVAVELTFEKKPRGYFTLVGDEPAAAAALVKEGANVVGANCTLSSADMIGLVPMLRAATPAPLLVQPNAGRPEMEHGTAVYKQRPDEFAADIAEIVNAGANAVGGCCGTNPDFIRAVRGRLTHGA